MTTQPFKRVGALLIAVIPGTGTIVDLWTMDLTNSESFDQKIDVSTQPTSSRFSITDHSTIQPLTLTLDGMISETPLSELVDRFFARNRRETQVDRLLKLARDGYLFQVQTGLTIYENMAITSASISRDNSTGQAINISISLQQVKLVQALSVEIPPLRVEPAARASNTPEQESGTTSPNTIGAESTPVEAQPEPSTLFTLVNGGL